ncbi:MAG TPA: glycosyltransferase family 2 protein [Burkholderiaceae bacterium]|jgi:glycosyltransferase involved in cell wall biosynthesis
MDKILVFIPAYRCEAQIVRVLQQFCAPGIVERFLRIVVVDNRSPDKTVEAAVAAARALDCGKVCVVRNRENYGLGGSHKAAFQYALANGFTHVVVLHGDDQGSIADLLPILDQDLHNQYDACLGARFMPQAKLVGYSRFRIFGNRVFNLLFSLAVGRRLYDLGSGLNIYRVAALSSQYWLRFHDNLMFNYCMILGHARRADNIRFFPISWREEDQISNVKLASQARRTLGILWRYVSTGKAFLEYEFRDVTRLEYRFDVIEGAT